MREAMPLDETLIVELTPPRIEFRSAFLVTGLAQKFTFETNHGIPALWQEFSARADEIPARVGSVAYGVCFNGDGAGNFDYMAGMETGAAVDGGVGFQTVELPAGKYVVFTHSGHISDFRKTAYTIWNKGLADAGVVQRGAPDFEVYDERFNGRTGQGEVDIWIPID